MGRTGSPTLFPGIIVDESKEQKQDQQQAQSLPHKNGRHDVWTHRMVVASLGLTVIFTGLNLTIIQVLGKEPSAALNNLGSVALGALAMCLNNIMQRH